MIATLTGRLQKKQPDRAIVDVGGVGYEVLISTRTYDQLPDTGAEIFLHIYTSVREDAITLFGFTREEDKKLYLLLNTVSGVGPKLSLGILSGISAAELSEAISTKNMGRLIALSGVGKKTAQRLCVELQDKVMEFRTAEDAQQDIPEQKGKGSDAVRDAVSALVNLGYPENLAWKALRKVQKSDDDITGLKVEDIIRLALRVIS